MHTPGLARRHSFCAAVALGAIVYGGPGVSRAGAQSASNAPAASNASAEASNPELDRVRASLEKYRDPVMAVHDGYLSTLGCIAIPKAGAAGEVPYKPGAMGVHFLNMEAVGPTVDPMKPQILLYEPRGDKLVLVGAEWFVPLATGVKERPVLFGHAFDGPMAGHHPLMPASLTHYDLHVWLFKPNPYGTFSATNPNVKCGSYSYTSNETAPKIVANPNR